jgi:hypothetical protein
LNTLLDGVQPFREPAPNNGVHPVGEVGEFLC